MVKVEVDESEQSSSDLIDPVNISVPPTAPNIMIDPHDFSLVASRAVLQ